MSINRVLPFLILNIIVSAIVVIIILTVWDQRTDKVAVPERSPVPSPTSVFSGGVTPLAIEGQPAEDVVREVSADSSQPPLTHEVGAGDSLGAISAKYGVLIEDIVQANGLDNPNQIFAGQQLIIPLGGLADPTTEPTPDLPPTPLSTVAIDASGETTVVISTISGQTDLAYEYVEISNTGANPVELTGWTLAEEAGETYRFQQVTLFGGGAAIRLHTRADQNNATDLYWGLEKAIWGPGELITLRDANGNVQATLNVP